MIISALISCKNRTHTLKVTLPHLIKAADASPPMEIVILDYNSEDDLAEYIESVGDSRIVYYKYAKRDYYHMAHAWNLSAKLSSGAYLAVLGTDTIPGEDYFPAVREGMADGYIWMHDKRLSGVVVCERQEFMNAGGYDERFEFYGPEDKDLDNRMIRRGVKIGILSNGLITHIYTERKDKFKNYRPVPSQRKARQAQRKLYHANCADGVLIANEGVEWGKQ